MANNFEGIESAQIGNQSNPPLTEGEYLLKITDVQFLKTQLRGDAFIVEFEVVETSDTAKQPIGAKRSWYQSFQKRAIALEQAKSFMLAVLGYDYKRDADRIKIEVDPNLNTWTNAACDQKALNGQTVRASVRKKAANAEAKAKAVAAGKPEPTGFDTVRFAPVKSTPPEVVATS